MDNQDDIIVDLINRIEKIENRFTPKIIKINYHRDKFPDLQPLEKHGNFYDLRAAEPIELKKGEHALINLGISLQLPEEYYAEIIPRSSTFKNFGFILVNSMGIIDTKYAGPNDIWFLSVLPERDMSIKVNDRIAQFTIVREEQFELIDGIWAADDRGGYGHSGIK